MQDHRLYVGVGQLWREVDGWWFQTAYGYIAGPIKRKCEAKMRLETLWAQESKRHGGVYEHNKNRESTVDDKLIMEARKLLSRRWV